jgi:hypothetical protein
MPKIVIRCLACEGCKAYAPEPGFRSWLGLGYQQRGHSDSAADDRSGASRMDLPRAGSGGVDQSSASPPRRPTTPFAQQMAARSQLERMVRHVDTVIRGRSRLSQISYI